MRKADGESRRQAVATLIGLAASPDYRDRADAGQALAAFADVADARDALAALVLDTGDTFVTRVTAEALLRRQDAAGIRVVAEALATADFQHQMHINDAVTAVFMVFAAERDRAVATCDALQVDVGEDVRRGIRQLRATLTQLQPILFPTDSP